MRIYSLKLLIYYIVLKIFIIIIMDSCGTDFLSALQMEQLVNFKIVNFEISNIEIPNIEILKIEISKIETSKIEMSMIFWEISKSSNYDWSGRRTILRDEELDNFASNINYINSESYYNVTEVAGSERIGQHIRKHQESWCLDGS